MNIRSDKKGVSNILAIAVVAVLVTATLSGAYLLLRDDGGDPNDNKNSGNSSNQNELVYADPLVQGNWGIGTTLRYTIESYTANGEIVDISYAGYYTELTVTVVGQSGSYYLLEMEFEHILILVHKTTGELRFADNIGEDSITYDGKNHSLQKWEQTILKISGANGDTSNYEELSTTISSDSSDGIPYRIGFSYEWNYNDGSGDTSSSYEVITFVLSSINLVDPEPYIKSDVIGTGYEYTVSGVEYEIELSANVVFIVAAEGVYGGEEVYFIMCSIEGTNEYYFAMVDYDTAAITDFDLTYFLVQGTGLNISELTPVEVQISTIDGEILCDKYSGGYYSVYIGQENGVLYIIEYEYNESTQIYTLHNYISG